MASASERIREIAAANARRELARLRVISQSDPVDAKSLAEITDRIEEALATLERVAELGPGQMDG